MTGVLSSQCAPMDRQHETDGRHRTRGRCRPFVVPIAAPTVSEPGEDRSAPNDAEFDAECTTNVNDRPVVNVSYRGGWGEIEETNVEGRERYTASTASAGRGVRSADHPGGSAFVSESDIERAIEVVGIADLSDGETVTITTFQSSCS